MDELERRYRRLMRAYPAAYRREREAEIVATLLDAAPPGQTRPTAADTADIVVAGMRARLGVLGTGDISLGLRAAAPVGLAVVAGMAVVGLLRDSEATAGHPSPFQPALWAYLAWLLAVAGRIALPALAAWALSGVALLGTFVALAAMPARWSSPSPGWSLVILALLGAVAVAGGRDPLSLRDRGRLAAGTAASVAILGGAALLVPDRSGEDWFGAGWAPLREYPSPIEAVAALAIALLLAGMAVLARRRGRPWRLATLILVATTGWLVVPGFAGGSERLSRGLLIVLSIGAAIWVLRRTAGVRPPSAALRVPAVLALGCAAGLAAAALLTRPQVWYTCALGQAGVSGDCQEMQRWIAQGRPAYVAWLVATVAWALLPRALARVAVGIAVVATPALLWPDQWSHPAPDNVMPITLSALGVVALLCSAGPATRDDRWGVVAASAAAYLLPIAIPLVVLGPSSITGVPGPWFAVAFVPLTVAAAVAWRVADRTTGRIGAVAAATVALSAAWLVVIAFEVARYPAVVALLAVAGAAALLLRLWPGSPPAVPAPLHRAP